MKKKSVSFFLLIALCGFLSAQPSNPGVVATNVRPAAQKPVINFSTKAVLGSVLFPGIGQMQNGEKTKGAVYMGVGAALLGLSIYSGMSEKNLWKTYDLSRTSADYNTYKQRVVADNLFIGMTVTFWAYNVIDAFKIVSYKKTVKCPECGLESRKELGFCPRCATKFN